MKEMKRSSLKKKKKKWIKKRELLLMETQRMVVQYLLMEVRVTKSGVRITKETNQPNKSSQSRINVLEWLIGTPTENNFFAASNISALVSWS